MFDCQSDKQAHKYIDIHENGNKGKNTTTQTQTKHQRNLAKLRSGSIKLEERPGPAPAAVKLEQPDDTPCNGAILIEGRSEGSLAAIVKALATYAPHYVRTEHKPGSRQAAFSLTAGTTVAQRGENAVVKITIQSSSCLGKPNPMYGHCVRCHTGATNSRILQSAVMFISKLDAFKYYAKLLSAGEEAADHFAEVTIQSRDYVAAGYGDEVLALCSMEPEELRKRLTELWASVGRDRCFETTLELLDWIEPCLKDIPIKREMSVHDTSENSNIKAVKIITNSKT